MSKVFIFIGPPGSGKGSLAKKCADTFGWMQVSTGNLCRKHSAEQTKIGKEIDLIIKLGKLIDDALITRMVSEWFTEHANKTEGVILDGYPRTAVQALSFNEIMNTYFPTVKQYIVRFCVADAVAIDRLCNRFVCENKNCQVAYSSKAESSLFSKNAGLCDICGSKLIKREDDNEATIIKRLEVYHKHEHELLDFYRANDQKIIELDVTHSPQKIFEDFVRMISSI